MSIVTDLSINVADSISVFDRASRSIRAAGAGKHVEEIARLHLTENKSVQEICKLTGLKKTRVYECVEAYKKRMVSAVKQDARTSGILLEHMVELVIQTKERIKIIYSQYGLLEKELERLTEEIASSTAETDQEETRVVADLRKERIKTHRRICNCLVMARKETKCMLDIYKAFGMSGAGLKDNLASEEYDLEEVVKRTEIYLSDIAKIVQFEIGDEVIKDRILCRIQDEAGKKLDDIKNSEDFS